ncbi:3-carboxy-cis,cis-muconate cycloisomerase [Poseidonocella pacifica]|uniref:3-carboxy-cis,cis-muconate cycloisomerase n=1 Tax=Poseidonocella pacifica TaxID=871651 RepID=A0A1I0Y3G3_9RHOB|nr:3-carboxy-cis,cis-muconate cycloisomerase [Poseidonocella pacifica]SFB07702.1 3-carboxy-cis,cis-muconate cycloisomerase [Poseidonocella pacifica]
MSTLASDPLLGRIFGDPEITALTGSEAWVSRMLEVEAAYSRALSLAGRVPVEIGTAASAAIRGLRLDMEAISEGMARDGVALPSLLRQIRASLPEDLHPAIHRGLTSQDVMDTALALCLKSVIPIFGTRIERVISVLDDLSDRFGSRPLMARTRMQAAMEITVADRIAAWLHPLPDLRDGLSRLSPKLLRLQFGGAVGNRNIDAADAINAAFADLLDLSPMSRAFHTDRTALVEFGGWLSLVTGSLGKIGQDIALMAQQGVDDISLRGGGGSSAMPHKQNPVGAEVLITLARFNAAQLGGLHQALVHEQERSGAAWSLEWLILPRMMEVTGRALTLADEVLCQVESIGQR